jgi:hypothetical protein
MKLDYRNRIRWQGDYIGSRRVLSQARNICRKHKTLYNNEIRYVMYVLKTNPR